jgi:hypothetical protein
VLGRRENAAGFQAAFGEADDRRLSRGTIAPMPQREADR